MMNRRPAETEALDQINAASVAQSLREDFIALISIFDGRPVNGADDGNNPLCDIADARAAAERGLRLSEKLIELLRTRS